VPRFFGLKKQVFGEFFMETIEKNRDVILNFGLVSSGKLGDIEELQQLIKDSKLRLVYWTVSAKRLKLVKMDNGDLNNGK
jgi:hypothetical protein